MEQQSLLGQLEPGIIETVVNRREAIRKGATVSGAVLAALQLGSVPVTLAALTREAYGQAPQNVVAILNYALILEYLEDEFYRAATTGSAFATARGQLTQPELRALQLISQHETAHVTFLRNAITGAGSTPVARPTFDFTGGNGSGNGPYAAATSDKAVLLAAAQAFEDTGVRAYKGRAGELVGAGAVLTAALQIHSVEARHAAQIRRLRGLPGWIVGNQRGAGLPAGLQPVYDGEENTTHANANIAQLGGAGGGADAVTASFDEPLTPAQVLAIVDPFIA